MAKNLLLALVLVAASAPAARADTLVFPVEGTDSTSAARLTRALLAAADRDTPRLADTPIGEAASLLECNAGEAACLESIAQAMETGALLAATVKPSGGVHVVAFRRGEGPRTSDLDLPSDPDAAAAALERAARTLLHGDGTRAVTPAAPPPAAPRETHAELTAPAPAAGFSLRRVRPWTWAVAGSGLVLVGVGTAFAIKASGLKDDVDAAPRDTVKDLEHLVDLEDQGESATTISNALLLGGGLALVTGAALAVWQGSRPSAEERGSALSLAPVAGGATLVFSGELP